ncbi:flagellar assembly protein FliH [Marinobacter lipolyticus]|uniref:flagellar assembly protein FliH n=1 Tax=Marinobacter lipolyticus TaxID=209639 RepID=UPI001BCFB646|nr:flagellar assembly protein FliH [Marinobacter lipolyticus]MBS8242129.1 flagellar assembly protein FliH [Marinobacter lipolyticus]
MKDSDKSLNRIPKEQLTAYERWELPLLDARGNEVAREEERDVKPLTAADIEAIRQAAREDGHAEGRDAGYQAGFSEGREQGHQEGLEAGFAEGRAEGEATGLEQTRKEMESRIDRLEHLLGELLVPIRRHEDELETALVNLTTVLARAVLYRELSMDSSQIQQVVRKAMAALPSTSDNVRIHVHPDDAQWVNEVAGRFEATSSVIEDDTILPGGCKLETRHSLVDFTVEKRFQKAVQSMLDQQLGHDESGDSEGLDAMMDDLTDFHRDVLASEDDTDDGSAGDQDEDEGDDQKPG